MTIDANELKDRLDFAVAVAREAGEFILPFFQAAELQIDLKGDLSPVTAADRGAETLIRERIEGTFPQDGVLGEEFGEKPSQNGCRWILDPLDGTKSFVHGVPLFGTLIGLEFDGRIVLGVCRMPALDEVVYAADGEGAWWQVGEKPPRRARVSAVSRLSEALHCFTEPEGYEAIGRPEVFERLWRASGINRGWSDCYGHVLVATGRAEFIAEPRLNPWDAAPFVPILEEAGGHFVAWNGETSIYEGNGLSVNSALKDTVLELLG